MNLAKTKLVVDESCNYSGIPLFLLIKGKEGKMLVTGPVLKRKRKDLWEVTRDEEFAAGYVIVKGKPHKLLRGGKYLVKMRKNKPVTKPIPPASLLVKRIHPNLLTEKQRAKLVGGGETGERRRIFVEEGLTAAEQRHRAEELTAMREVEWRKTSRAAKRERRKKNRKRTDAPPEIEEETVSPDATVTVKDIAKMAGLEGGEIRKFLRKKKIGKRGGRYAFTDQEAKKVARAAKKHYAKEEA